MSTLNLKNLAGLSTALLFSAAAIAADTGASQFDALDQDKNGQLTAEEASQDKALSEQWTLIDKDENGTVDRVEFSAFETLETKAMDAKPMKKDAQQ